MKLKFWIRFWVSRGRCPKCLKRFYFYNDFGIEFDYCSKHLDEAYYENGTKVAFQE